MFWGPGKLRGELSQRLAKDFRPDRIDGASYQLSIGDEIYVSPTAEATDPGTKSIVRLKEKEAFTIPPGQFAFILTKEVVEVGLDEIAFISIRARTKYRGLVNVSGFHVDPGFEGHLTFAVFNAGPVAVHLRQGQPIFLIWYANITDPVSKTQARDKGPWQIRSEWISGIGGKLHSLASLASSVNEVEKKLQGRLDSVTRELATFRVVAAIAVTALLGILVRLVFFPQ
ncbi:MAG: deoxycytidine triphosphate deaminase [Gammaproteobacteria bacterium]|nr:deoxycytidine triphosphate deaminase [Gammaproteobacteria bacterium]